MGIHDAIDRGAGYYTGARLTDHELGMMRQMITDQYVAHLRTIDPDLAADAERVGIADYHLLQGRLDHANSWPKASRVLPAECVPVIAGMGFCQAIAAEYGEFAIYPDDLMWRLVRPHASDDVGPVHADRWFWDLGNGAIPDGWERFKIWIPIFVEPGLNGLCVKPYSHLRDDWKRHGDHKHGKVKPVLDEKVEDLHMELLPLAAGQMVMFHDGLLHGGVINKGTRCRVSLEMTIFYRRDFEARTQRRVA
jgi:hypothetical protein